MYIALHSAGYAKISNKSEDMDNVVTLVEEPPLLKTLNCLEESDIYNQLNMNLSSVKKLLEPICTEPKTSNICIHYLYCMDILCKILESHNVTSVVEMCSTFMASTIHNITLFSSKYLKEISECSCTNEVVKLLLCAYSTWCDYSIAEQLIKLCGTPEYEKLLERFRNTISTTEKNGRLSYPTPSHLMVPSESSSFTVMATRYINDPTLHLTQQINLVKSLIKAYCEITDFAFLFLAKINEPSILYWLIPKSVVSIIITKAHENSQLLKDGGILEVAVYPSFMYATHKSIDTGAFQFLAFDVRKNTFKNVYVCLICEVWI